MSVIFFGDSLTEGSNSPRSFVDILGRTGFVDVLGRVSHECINRGISGTTIGEYSIYPVDGYSLSQLYPKDKSLSDVDSIVLEYGINDVSSIMCGFTTLEIAIVSCVKALDGISQINNRAKKVFLSISDNPEVVNEMARRQCDYLANVYFAGYDFSFPYTKWADNYNTLIREIAKRIKVVPMIDDMRFFDYNAGCISDDNIHPNYKGHTEIAFNIKQYI